MKPDAKRVAALYQTAAFNPYRTGHKYGLDLDLVDNRSVKEYSADHGGNSGIAGLFYATGTVTDSSRPGKHPFKALIEVNEEPRSGHMVFYVKRAYGSKMDAKIAAHVLETDYAKQGEFMRKLGELEYVPDEDGL